MTFRNVRNHVRDALSRVVDPQLSTCVGWRRLLAYTHANGEGCSGPRCRQWDGRAAILGRSDQRMSCATFSVYSLYSVRTS